MLTNNFIAGNQKIWAAMTVRIGGPFERCAPVDAEVRLERCKGFPVSVMCPARKSGKVTRHLSQGELAVSSEIQEGGGFERGLNGFDRHVFKRPKVPLSQIAFVEPG